ncbi:MAG: uracil-DNA glycosylase [Clostridia bacterium]|nr:uracil-DNA glycosylase [Clostridia bacterium]
MVDFKNDWNTVLNGLIKSDLYADIRKFLIKEYSSHYVYPPMALIFNAFYLTPYDSVKAVILGQDPYHEYGQAHGLSFSVTKGTPLPPSLKNIYKELKTDLGIDNGLIGDLTPWAKQGVLLLNATLTVRDGQANSHANCGWGQFTDEVIRLLSAREKPIVFILWGANARSKKQLIDTTRHFIVESPHPSPLSASYGFFGSKPFSKTNAFLKSTGQSPIDWKL